MNKFLSKITIEKFIVKKKLRILEYVKWTEISLLLLWLISFKLFALREMYWKVKIKKEES